MAKTFRKTLALLLAAIMIFGSAPLYGLSLPVADLLSTKAEAAIYRGTCGAKLSVSYNSELKTLVISGEGTMYDYNWNDPDRPWHEYREEIETIIISNGVTTIGDCAFIGSDADIVLPTSIKYIGDYSLSGRILYCGTAEQWSLHPYKTDPMLLPAVFEYNTENAYRRKGTCGKNTTWTLWADGTLEISGTGTVEATDLASGWHGATSLVIHEGITGIGASAFSEFSLIEVSLPSTLTSVGNGAFSNNRNLKSISIPDSVTSIGYSAFYGCSSLEQVNLPDGLEALEFDLFRDCSALSQITIPESVTAIGNNVFTGTALYNNFENSDEDVLYLNNHLIKAKNTLEGEYSIKEGTKSIADHAFWNCRITGVTIPDSVKTIGENAFYNCTKLENIIIPDSVETIGENAFYRTVRQIVFENNLDESFYLGNHLILVKSNASGEYIIPANTASVAEAAFSSCSYIEKITVADGNTRLSSDERGVLYNADKTVLISYPQSAEGTEYTLPMSVKKIFSYAFYSYSNNLSAVCYPGTSEQWNNITVGLFNYKLDGKLIFECNSARPYFLKGYCGEDVTYTLYADGELAISGTGKTNSYSINGDAPWYKYRYNIKKITVNEGVTEINHDAFYGLENVTDVSFADSLNSIPSSVNNSSIVNDFENSDEEVLYANDCLIRAKDTVSGTYHVKEGTKKIFSFAFSYCDNLTELVIPASVTKIYADWNTPFDNRSTFKKITVDPANTAYSSDENGCLYNKDKTVLLYTPYAGTAAHLDIPEGVKTVCCVGSQALKSITIPASVTKIEDSAVRHLRFLEKITVDPANTVYSSDDHGALYTENGTVLFVYPLKNPGKNFTVPYNVTTIDSDVFDEYTYTAIESVKIPVTVTEIYSWPRNSQESFTLYYEGSFAQFEQIVGKTPYSTVIYNCGYEKPYYATGSCGDNLTWTVYVDGSLVISGTGAMYDYLEEQENGKYWFLDSPWDDFSGFTDNPLAEIKEIIIENGVTSIGAGAFFYFDKLEKVTIPDSVTSIGVGAFLMCSSLETVNISENVTNIGYQAFSSCQALQSLNVDPENTVYSSDEYGVLFNKNKSVLIHYPCGNKNTHYIVPKSVETVGDGAFAMSKLEHVELLDGVKTIGLSAFSNCQALCSITIPASVKSFGDNILAATTATIRYRSSKSMWDVIEKGSNDFSANNIIYDYYENLISVTDPATGIIVSGLNTDDYNGTLTLSAKECSDEDANLIVNTNNPFARKTKLYDITVLCNNQAVQPSTTVTVRIPLSSSSPFNKKLTKVYHVDEKTGERTPVPVTFEGNFIVFTVTHFSYYAIVEEYELNILRNPGTVTLNYGESLHLTAEHNGTDGETVLWYVDGELKSKGSTFVASPKESGSEVRAVLADKFGNPICDKNSNDVSDSQRIEVKSGFFMKLISFFKNLFRINRTVTQ